MIAPKRSQRVYDHRLREVVCSTGDTGFALRIGVPRSTAFGWLRPREQPVVLLVPNDNRLSKSIETEVVRLRQQVAKLRHLLRLLFLILKLSGFSFQNFRVPSSEEKLRLLKQINKSTIAIPLGRLLKVIGLSRSRFHAWNEAEACELTDKSSCPKSYPSQLTGTEIDTIRSMVTSADYRHLSTGAVSRVARKILKVFAAPATWYRLVRLRNWRRPRLRIHPTNPKVGIRASKPNEIWHVDTSLLRLLDGSRVYMHAVIDNFSRRILAWTVERTYRSNCE